MLDARTPQYAAFCRQRGVLQQTCNRLLCCRESHFASQRKSPHHLYELSNANLCVGLPRFRGRLLIWGSELGDARSF